MVGLPILKEFIEKLPDYDFMYLGDNARAPYGNRSFEYSLSVHAANLCNGSFNRAVHSLSWPVILLLPKRCAPFSSRIFQHQGGEKRVLGVIRPTTEIIGTFTKTGQVGILATTGTVQSGSYPIEIEKFFPGIRIFQQACPMWVPLIENNEHLKPGADYFVKEYIDQLLSQSKEIDTILLACTHYPLLKEKITAAVSPAVKIISQGEIVANSLIEYLHRHPEMDARCSRQGRLRFFTTDSTIDFDRHATNFYGHAIQAEHVVLSA